MLEHRSSERMHHVDTLSRNYSVLIITENSFERNLSILQNLDPEIVEIKTKLQQAENKFFKLSNGLVYRKGQGKLLFYIPSSTEHNVIRANHEQVAHQRINNTCEYLGRVYWFPRMKQKVRQFIGNCLNTFRPPAY